MYEPKTEGFGPYLHSGGAEGHVNWAHLAPWVAPLRGGVVPQIEQDGTLLSEVGGPCGGLGHPAAPSTCRNLNQRALAPTCTLVVLKVMSTGRIWHLGSHLYAVGLGPRSSRLAPS